VSLLAIDWRQLSFTASPATERGFPPEWEFAGWSCFSTLGLIILHEIVWCRCARFRILPEAIKTAKMSSAHDHLNELMEEGGE
jgi:hypothetical protein